MVTKGFQLTAHDVDIIRLVYEYRMLHRQHLAALTGRRPDSVHRRVAKLLKHRFLARKTLPQHKHIYFTGSEGISILVELGLAPREKLEHRLRHHERKELTLKHDLLVVDVHVMLSLALRDSPVNLEDWQEGRGLWERVPTPKGQLPLRPDGFFQLRDQRRPEGRSRRNFFLEVDRSTMSHANFKEKLTAYWYYFERKLYGRKYGEIPWRVVTVALTDERARLLTEAAEELFNVNRAARKYLLFSSFARFSLETPAPIVGDAFWSARNWQQGGMLRLMPEPT